MEMKKKTQRCSPEFNKKSQELTDQLRDIAIGLYNYLGQQATYSNGELRSHIENVYRDLLDLQFSIEKTCKKYSVKEDNGTRV